MRSLMFEIECDPPKSTAQGSSTILRNRRTGKNFIGKKSSSKATAVKGTLMNMLMDKRPKKPFLLPVSMEVVWTYPWRKDEPLKNRVLGQLPCDTRPDIDNILKLLLDTMTKLRFWKDDAQVAQMKFTKLWGENPGIKIFIREVDVL